jgi:branched-chain amino acid aminotransferase
MVNVNGEVLPGDRPCITLDNRAFHFGDGLFESIRLVHGRPCFLDGHWARLSTGARVLRIDMPAGMDRRAFEQRIVELVTLSGAESARCRFTLFRGGGGRYTPESGKGQYTIELFPLTEPSYALNEDGLVVDIWPGMRKPINDLARLKTLNGLFYVMAALWSQERHLDDCLLQNERGNIIESSSGNLFIVSNGVLYTPSLSDGCMGGVMRAEVINLALAHGIKVYECSLNPQNLLAADELFFTNAVSGLRWVSAYRTKRYGHRLSTMLTGHLVRAVEGRP